MDGVRENGGLIVRNLIKALTNVEKAREEGFEYGWDLAHERAQCGHVRANYLDPDYPISEGGEECEFCLTVHGLSRDSIDRVNDAVTAGFIAGISVALIFSVLLSIRRYYA